jgi:hypothetical protein
LLAAYRLGSLEPKSSTGKVSLLLPQAPVCRWLTAALYQSQQPVFGLLFFVG